MHQWAVYLVETLMADREREISAARRAREIRESRDHGSRRSGVERVSRLLAARIAATVSRGTASLSRSAARAARALDPGVEGKELTNHHA